ncbi:MAG: SHOCT domain-containing protein [Gaiellaceae bacterium]
MIRRAYCRSASDKEQTMMNWSGGMGAAGWVLISVLWVVLIAVIVWAVAAIFGRGDRSGGGVAISERPEEILDRRLASGEIDAETYDALRTKLRAARAQRV